MNTSGNPEVSVIIVNYRTANLTADCIASVISHTHGVTYEIIVVDNNSDDNFAQILEDRFPGVVITLPLDDNVGFGRANNAGMRIAKGKNFFFLNSDTILLNDAISVMSTYLELHPEAGACGGNLFHPDMKPAHSFRRLLPGPFWDFSERFKRHPERLIYGRNTRFNHTSHPLKVAYITGADLMVKRSVIDITGGFAPEFFMYFEETDLCARIANAGFDIVSIPTARIIHLEGGSMTAKSREEQQRSHQRRMAMYNQSREIYYQRNLSPRVRRLADFFRKKHS